MPCIKIDKPLGNYIFWYCYEMMPITTLHTGLDKLKLSA